MLKTAISPILTTPIASETLILGIWNRYFAAKYNQAITPLLNAIHANDQIRNDLQKVFPVEEDFWKQFGHDPTSLTFEQLKDGIDRVLSAPVIKTLPEVVSALNLFIKQYELMLKQLSQQEQPKKTTKTDPGRIKQLQQLLGVKTTGVWNKTSNDVFLKWLRDNKWDNYIRNDRYVGKIDDAIRALLMEKV